MGAVLLPKDLICCGTLSSRTRKLPRGMLGMKWPFLSRTATSTLTTFTSLLKLGRFSGMSGCAFLLSFDGMGASSGSPVDLRGLATVWSTSFVGPAWSWAMDVAASANSAARATGRAGILFQDFIDITIPQVNYSREDAAAGALVFAISGAATVGERSAHTPHHPPRRSSRKPGPSYNVIGRRRGGNCGGEAYQCRSEEHTSELQSPM